VHHIVFDGGSVDTFLNDLLVLYRNKKLKPIDIHYKDYAEWEVKYKKTKEYKAKRDYWKEKLSGELPPLEMMTDFSRKAEWNYAGHTLKQKLSDDVYKKIQKLESQLNVTAYSILISAYNILLSKYTRQEDVVIGAAVSGRSRPEVQEIVGMFANTLPFRSFIDNEMSCKDVFFGAQKNMLEMLSNQDYYLTDLVNDIGIKNDIGRNPIYDIIFNYLPEEEKENFNLKLVEPDTAKFDINLTATESADGMMFSFEYKTSLFKESTMQRFVQHYINVLDVLLDAPETTVKEICILSATEEKQILEDFNGASADYPLDSTIVKLFESVVDKYPNNKALVYKNREYTYRELSQITDYIGAKLRESGVQRDDKVPVSVDRSEYIVIGALSISKAGGAYIFIDPTYPFNRKEYIVKDCSSKIVLVDSNSKGVFTPIEGVEEEFHFEELLKEIEKLDEVKKLEYVNQPQDIFGIITTSGSTGEPKGTMIEHRNYINFAYYYNGLTDTKPGDQVASYASFSFDVSVATNFAPLLHGATVHIIPSEIRLDINQIAEYFKQHSISVTFLPTPIGELYIKEIEESSLKSMAIGGEQLKSYHRRGYRVINAYAPSECTIAVLMGDIDEKRLDRIPLGWVQPNNKVYIFDEGMNLCPIGVPGELYIGGVQVGRGYHNRPDQNEERFIVHKKYGRLYKSGDLSKWLEDGQVVYLGRIDFQVKISGLRIELGEIENRTVEIEGIEDAVVLALDDPAGNKYLCGYYVSANEISKDEIREALLKSLPDYMAPNVFVHMDKFTLTPNGKIDRKNLPKPDISKTFVDSYIAPETDLEKDIAGIWSAALGLEKVGVKDNFFDMGGSSIKAVAVVSKLQKFMDVTVADIFSFPTIIDLIANVEVIDNTLEKRFDKIKKTLKEELPDKAKAYLAKETARYEELLKKYDKLNLNKTRDIRNVLLTGATGYLGVHILHELLVDSDKSIFCIIRGNDINDSRRRLESKLKFYFGETFYDKYKNRIRVLKGDLSDNELGLNQDEYKQLAEQVESIIHTAANVGHYGEYEVFYKANVQPVINLIDLCKKDSKKDFHYISTRSVCDLINIPDKEYYVASDFDDISNLPAIYNIYVKTKLEGEKAAIEARADGVNASIYRVGNLVFNSETGKHQENLEDNGFYQTIKAYLNLGYVSDVIDEVEMSYIDYTAKAICKLFDKENLQNEIFHAYNPHKSKLSEIFSDPDLGLNIEALSVDNFFDYLYSKYDRKAFADFIQNFMLHSGFMEDETSKTTVFVLQKKTDIILEKLGFNWKKMEPSSFKYTIYEAFKDRINWFAKHGIFKNIDEELMITLSKSSRLQEVDKNSNILLEGKENKKVYFITSGMLTESKKSYGGWEGILRILSEGSVLGFENLCDKKASGVSVEAMLKEAVYLEISIDHFKKILRKNKTLFENIFDYQLKENEKLKRMILALS